MNNAQAVCRGSILLGSGCGQCARCESERKTLLRHVAVSRAALRLFDNRQSPHPGDDRPFFEELWNTCWKMREHLRATAENQK